MLLPSNHQTSPSTVSGCKICLISGEQIYKSGYAGAFNIIITLPPCHKRSALVRPHSSSSRVKEDLIPRSWVKILLRSNIFSLPHGGDTGVYRITFFLCSISVFSILTCSICGFINPCGIGFFTVSVDSMR